MLRELNEIICQMFNILSPEQVVKESIKSIKHISFFFFNLLQCVCVYICLCQTLDTLLGVEYSEIKLCSPPALEYLAVYKRVKETSFTMKSLVRVYMHRLRSNIKKVNPRST